MEALRSGSIITLPNDRGIRPPLKWAGGKRWLAMTIKDMFEACGDKRLVEPFCGGLAVTLAIQPQRALLNDINPHAINFYKWMKRGLVISIAMLNDENAYYKCREDFNDLILRGESDTKQAAELFYYLNRTGYNGLCRFNKAGMFNVPFGRYSNINYRRDFKEYKRILCDWHFIDGDFELLDVSHKDFLYADPPYDVEFTQYAREGFTWKDQERLAIWLSKHRGPVVVSNQATDRMIELYSQLKFAVEIVDAPRMISCTGNRAKAKEILAYKNI